MTGDHPGDQGEVRTFWEERYAERPRIWSGAVNRTLVEAVTSLGLDPRTEERPRAALDLGCGEGADAIWLAEQGWAVTAVDVSATALDRAQQEASARGLPSDGIDWRQLDLSSDVPAGPYDLVSACFLASPVHLPRDRVLRQAAGAVAPGGALVVVSHAAAPPWSHHHHDHDQNQDQDQGHHPDLPSPADELETLSLGAGWEVLIAEVRERPATGPDGESALLHDTLVVTRRTTG